VLENLLGSTVRDPRIGIGKHVVDGLALMRVGHGRTEDAPKPLNGIAIGIVGGSVDQDEVLAFLFHERAEQLGATRDTAGSITSGLWRS
jgi:hypothetical protein